MADKTYRSSSFTLHEDTPIEERSNWLGVMLSAFDTGNNGLTIKLYTIDKQIPTYHFEGTLAELIELVIKARVDANLVKLPSEKELALWLVGHLEYTSSELAKKLLGRLKGE